MILKVFRAGAVAVLTASVAAQQPAPTPVSQDVKATVSIGDTAAPPNWELSVPVMVKMAEGAEVGRLTMRLAYPAKPLRYIRVKPTETLLRAGFDVKAAAPKVTGDTGSVELEFKPADKESTLLPSGTVAILVFKVGVDAEEKSASMTANDLKAWGPGPTAPAVTAVAKGPAVFVVSPAGLPIFGCFFYMH